MSRNTKHLYTELAFEDGFALVDESIAREQIRQKRLKRQRARKKARRRALRRRIILMLLVGIVVCSTGLLVYEQFLSHEVVLGNRVYQNPLKYYQIQDNISLDGGDYELSEGYEGLKTAKVIQALGLGNAVGMNGALYTSEVADKVADYQAQHGLDATGTVDLTTWLAMGLSEEDWYTLGAYVSPLRIDNTSSRTACIEAMISRAYDYLGDNYVIGASGAPGIGIDCSGLIMQALYAAGIDMSPINPVRHASPGYEYESANIWASSKFKHVDYKERRRGDIIIYCNEKGTVIHSAIYLGDDKVIEAWPNQVTESAVLTYQHPLVKGVVRPFV